MNKARAREILGEIEAFIAEIDAGNDETGSKGYFWPLQETTSHLYDATTWLKYAIKQLEEENP